MERYFASKITLSERADPITFWVENESSYPLLSAVAIDLLSIPASSAPVEHVFSIASEFTMGKRNRLSTLIVVYIQKINTITGYNQRTRTKTNIIN